MNIQNKERIPPDQPSLIFNSKRQYLFGLQHPKELTLHLILRFRDELDMQIFAETLTEKTITLEVEPYNIVRTMMRITKICVVNAEGGAA